MFKKLLGFLGEKDNLGQEGASAKPVRKTFLAACGEYPPTNQCLHDPKSDNEAVIGALDNFSDKCKLYFQTFRDNLQNCILAYESYNSEKDESKKLEILRKAYDEYVEDKIHIFGVKPECNDSLKP